jgi:hypothetical protein
MDNRLFPEISCVECGGSLDMTTDLCADENGSAIHGECFLKHLGLQKRGVKYYKPL